LPNRPWHRQAETARGPVNATRPGTGSAALATVRGDGAPRISATEVTFAGGQVSLGMMAEDYGRLPSITVIVMKFR
jgi:hypothetical protein